MDFKLKPEILCHPNIPLPLHGLSPRSINGQAWWDLTRKEVYLKYNQHCLACGVHRSEAKKHKWLEAHEFYNIDYTKGTMSVKSIEPLCHYCHNFIHSGRLQAIYGKEKSLTEVVEILEHGFQVLAKSKLQCFPGTLDFALQVKANTFNVSAYKVKCEIPWEKWRLVWNGKEYFSKFKNEEELNKFYSKESVMQRPISSVALNQSNPVKPVQSSSAYTEIIQSNEQSKPVLIIGKSGSGKSTSIKNLPPKNTFIINVIGKALPFKGWRKNFTPWEKGKGNMLCSDNYSEIESALNDIKKRKEIKYVVLDDFQYLMAGEFMNRAYEKGYDKWNELGKHAYDLLLKLRTLGNGLIVFVLAHSDTNEAGETDVKTLGRMLSDKIIVAGLFTVVLQCFVEKGKFYFETKSENGKSVMKAPHEMFSTRLIPNDLKGVAEAIKKFEND